MLNNAYRKTNWDMGGLRDERVCIQGQPKHYFYSVTVESVNTNVTFNVEKCCISVRGNVILIIIQINNYCTYAYIWWKISIISHEIENVIKIIYCPFSKDMLKIKIASLKVLNERNKTIYFLLFVCFILLVNE